MNRPLALVPIGLLIAIPLVAQTPAAAREPVAVKASFDQTWAAVEKVVQGNLVNDRLFVLEESAGYRKGRWALHIPAQDFRAASWASCQSGSEAPISPRGGLATVEVRGDSAAATVVVSVAWSVLSSSEMQQAVQCRSLNEYEQDVEKNVKKNAERAARR